MRTREILIWFLAITAAFFAVDSLSLHTGDDLGYMFADSAHHSADGPRVTSLAQCISTQCSHYFTTNGRFLVHVAVMALLNLVPLWLFRLLNSLVFASLWLLTLRMAAPGASSRPSRPMAALSLLMLLAALPQPALLLFSLVAYAVNYLWVALAVTAFILALRRRQHAWWIYPLALITGSLQESFALPLCAGLFLASCLRRVNPWITLAFIIGTAIEVFAPGNMAHAGQSGGFTLSAVLTRMAALGRDCFLTVVPYSIIAFILFSFFRPRRARAFFFENTENFVLSVAVVASLCLACLTFTSLRQLTCPSLFLIFLVLKAVSPRLSGSVGRLTFIASVALTALFLALLAVFRFHIHQKWHSLLLRAEKPVALAYPDDDISMSAPLDLGGSFIWAAVAPDPLASRGLVGPGDRYTKKGLSRLRRCSYPDAPELTALLPYSPRLIIASATRSHVISADSASVNVSSSPIGLYSVISLPDSVWRSLGSPLPSVPFESFSSGSCIYLVVSGSSPSLPLNKRAATR